MNTVAVIGLGPAGITAVKELKAAGLKVQGFDRSCRVGGRWSFDPSLETGVWQELCLNGTRRVQEFSDFPWSMENNYPGRDKAYKEYYPHCTEMSGYLDAYVKHFDLVPHLKLETEVKKVERDDNGRWKVTIQTRSGGDESTLEFDALVVCTGMHCKPFHPLQETFRNFTGTVMHSKSFRSAKDYEGKQVLVIGSGISGGDITAALATNGTCQSLTNSARRIPYHVTKFSQTTGQALDETIFVRLACWLGRILPDSVTIGGLQKKLMVHYPEQLTDKTAWQGPDPDVRQAGVSYTVNYLECYHKGLFDIKPGIASAQGNTVTFVDGTKADYDVIICATGYEPDLSFLPPDVEKEVMYTSIFSGKREIACYKHTLVPGIKNLAFSGIIEGIGVAFMASELQARYIAATFSGKVPRPSDEKLRQGVLKFKKRRESHAFNGHDLALEVGEQVGDELGVTPSYWDAICQPKKYLLSPMYSCYYRSNPNVDDAELARKSRERFELYLSTPCIVKEV